jgi:hypothetical protein
MIQMLYDLSYYSENKYVLCFFFIKTKSVLNLISEISVNRIPKKNKKMTVLRSTHVNKKSKEQLESSTRALILRINPFPMRNILFQRAIDTLASGKPSDLLIRVRKFIVPSSYSFKMHSHNVFVYEVKNPEKYGR